jgi:hypothetical protein
MTKRRTPSQKLADLFNESAPGQPRERLAAEARELVLLLDPATPQGEINWADLTIHQPIASLALSPRLGTKYFSAVEVAFKKANLDVNNPFSWTFLLEMFCWAHFGATKSRGAPVKWNADRYCQLLRDFDEKKSRNATLSVERISNFIAKMPAYQMKNGKPTSTDRITKLLKKARDPRYNTHLNHRVDEFIAAVRTVAVEHGEDWSPDRETKLRHKLIEQNRVRIGTSWNRTKTVPQ